jgi:hypothetical protein
VWKVSVPGRVDGVQPVKAALVIVGLGIPVAAKINVLAVLLMNVVELALVILGSPPLNVMDPAAPALDPATVEFTVTVMPPIVVPPVGT